MRDVYALWRPTPLIRARRLEKALDTPARIYYKYEGVSPAGSHKPNTAVAQAYYNKQEGVKRLATETGAGQWGSALWPSPAAVRHRVQGLHGQGQLRAEALPPLDDADLGRQRDAQPQRRDRRRAAASWPRTPTRRAAWASPSARRSRRPSRSDDTKYSLGSVLNHVLLHQTVIGLEAMKQMELAGEYPDVVIGCVGGGSNFAGLAFPFVRDKLATARTRASWPSSRRPARP